MKIHGRNLQLIVFQRNLTKIVFCLKAIISLQLIKKELVCSLLLQVSRHPETYLYNEFLFATVSRQIYLFIFIYGMRVSLASQYLWSISNCPSESDSWNAAIFDEDSHSVAEQGIGNLDTVTVNKWWYILQIRMLCDLSFLLIKDCRFRRCHESNLSE